MVTKREPNLLHFKPTAAKKLGSAQKYMVDTSSQQKNKLGGLADRAETQQKLHNETTRLRSVPGHVNRPLDYVTTRETAAGATIMNRIKFGRMMTKLVNIQNAR